jgi:DNA modification methylase
MSSTPETAPAVDPTTPSDVDLKNTAPAAKINAIVNLPIDKLIPNEFNPNVMDQSSFGQLMSKIRQNGFDEPLQVVKKGDEYVIIGGEHRWKCAKLLNFTEIPCVIYDWDDRRAMEECVARNLIRGELDHEKFGSLLASYLKDEKTFDWAKLCQSFAVTEQDLYKAAQSNDNLKEIAQSMKDADHVPKVKPTQAPVSQTGDIWQLGDHKIICGDSTKPETYKLLMEDKMAALMSTDPPYGVDYTESTRPKSSHGKSKGKDWSGVYNEIDIVDYYAFLKDTFTSLIPFLMKHTGWYVWHAHRRELDVHAALKDCGILVHQQIIWVKPSLIATYCHYPWLHEPCQPAGTKVLVSGTRANQQEVPIESLKDGDRVVSYKPFSGNIVGRRKGNPVKVSTRLYKGDMYEVSVGDRKTQATDGHLWSVRFAQKSASRWCVYLMRRGDWWRVGQCKIFAPYGCNLKLRTKAEHADASWILSTHENELDALCAEQVASVRYGIPTTHWRVHGTESCRSEDQIKKIYDCLDKTILLNGALKALADYGRRLQYPLFERDTFSRVASRLFTCLVRSSNLIPEIMELPIPDKYGEEFSWHPIASIRRTPYDGIVYSLDVEGNHHYVADGIVTHNCFFGFKEGEPPASNEKGVNWYLDQHESASFGWFKGSKPPHQIDSGRHLTTVWQVDYDGKGRSNAMEHPTSKPVRLFEIPMLHHTQPGDICLEPFSGSGSQIIAGERVGRKVYAIEISPVFVDVAIRRWQRYTGMPAKCLTRDVRIVMDSPKDDEKEEKTE